MFVWNCDTLQAVALAERMRKATERTQAREGDNSISVSASFGVATFARSESYADVFNHADGALYKAKRAGRNRVVASSEMAVIEPGNQDDLVDSEPVGNVVSLMR